MGKRGTSITMSASKPLSACLKAGAALAQHYGIRAAAVAASSLMNNVAQSRSVHT